jgi:hypothetical protein
MSQTAPELCAFGPEKAMNGTPYVQRRKVPGKDSLTKN